MPAQTEEIVVVRDYTTKELYEVTRTERDADHFYRGSVSDLTARIKKLNNEILERVQEENRSSRSAKSFVPVK